MCLIWSMDIGNVRMLCLRDWIESETSCSSTVSHVSLDRSKNQIVSINDENDTADNGEVVLLQGIHELIHIGTLSNAKHCQQIVHAKQTG